MQRLLDDLFPGVDIPNAITLKYHYDEKITAAGLSYHGFLLALGFEFGKILIVDSIGGYTIRKISGHTSIIKALAFSRDTRSLISGDIEGNIIVHDLSVYPPNPIFTTKFDRIKKIAPNLSDPDHFAVLTKTNSLFHIILSSKTVAQISGSFHAMCWPEGFPYIISGEHRNLFFLDPDNNVISETLNSVLPKSYLTRLESNLSGKKILIFDFSGHVRIFDLETKHCTNNLFDHLEKTRWRFGSFLPSGLHVIVGLRNLRKPNYLAVDSDQGSVVYEYKENDIYPSQMLLTLKVHPIRPIIFAIYDKGVHIVSVKSKIRSLNMIPKGIQNISTNVKTIDLISKQEFYYFPSDKKFPNQFYRLPYVDPELE